MVCISQVVLLRFRLVNSQIHDQQLHPYSTPIPFLFHDSIPTYSPSLFLPSLFHLFLASATPSNPKPPKFPDPIQRHGQSKKCETRYLHLTSLSSDTILTTLDPLDQSYHPEATVGARFLLVAIWLIPSPLFALPLLMPHPVSVRCTPQSPIH